MMEKSRLIEIIKSIDSKSEIKEGKQFTEVSVPAENLHELAKQLHENEETCFDFLFCLTGVDYGKELGVVYHIRSTKHDHAIVLKIRTNDRDKPIFDSVYDIWKTAEFHEREIFDLLGIRFKGHPDLRRLFLDSSWGFPLRKDYVDDINVVTR